MDSPDTLNWPTSKTKLSPKQFLISTKKKQFFKQTKNSCPFERTNNVAHSSGPSKKIIILCQFLKQKRFSYLPEKLIFHLKKRFLVSNRKNNQRKHFLKLPETPSFHQKKDDLRLFWAQNVVPFYKNGISKNYEFSQHDIW